jgi:hypothetical protein
MKDEDEGFRKLAESTGFDPRRDLREIVVASAAGSKQGLMAARGSFDGARIGRFLEAEGGKKELYRGVEVWSGKGGEDAPSFAFADSSLALFGSAAQVKEAISRHLAGGGGWAGPLAARVNDWGGRHDAWLVSAVPFSEMGKGPGGLVPGGLNLDSIREANVGVRFGPAVDVAGELTMRSPQDAAALADLARFLVSMVNANAQKPGMEELGKVAESFQTATSGERMKFSLSISEQQLERLLEGGRRAKQRTAARRAEAGGAKVR